MTAAISSTPGRESFGAPRLPHERSTIELAQLASRARPKFLLLCHQLYWGATDEELVAEIARRYHGPIVSARDLGIY
jgi:ribonuclease BN (tRNA processing enzyme)